MVHGTQDTAAVALGLLGIGIGDVPRFRDAWLVSHPSGPRVVIHTRTGGGNRDYYDSEERCRDEFPERFGRDGEDDPCGPWNADLRALPGFLYDEDEEFDCTYANFYFKVPEEHRDAVQAYLDAKGDPKAPAERWEAVIEAIRNAKPK
jgi:hypothetical protein